MDDAYDSFVGKMPYRYIVGYTFAIPSIPIRSSRLSRSRKMQDKEFNSFRNDMIRAQKEANNANKGVKVFAKGSHTLVEPNLPAFTLDEMKVRYEALSVQLVSYFFTLL